MTQYPDYIGSDTTDLLDQAFDRIGKALIGHGASFLFGAGMSRASGVPTGPELLHKLLTLFFPATGQNPPQPDRIAELAAEFPFEAVVHALEHKPGLQREDLTTTLKELLLDNRFVPSKAHHEFLSLWVGGRPPRADPIFTTNFDTLLEQVIGPDLGIPITEANYKDLRKARENGQIPIVHLHGMLSGIYQITEPDVMSDNYRLLMADFRNALSTADAFVCVGYSLSDPDFRRIYGSYRQEIEDRKRADRTTYVVSPPKDRFSHSLGSAIWRLRGAVWIPLDAVSFFSRLKEVVYKHSLSDARQEVKRKYDCKDDAALDELIARTAEILRINHQDALSFMLEARNIVGGKQ